VDDVGRPLDPPIVTAFTFGCSSHEDVEWCHGAGLGSLHSRYANPTVRAAEQPLEALDSPGHRRAVYLFELPSFSGSKVPPLFEIGGPVMPGTVAPSGSVPSGLS
jgi:hypothetical protein